MIDSFPTTATPSFPARVILIRGGHVHEPATTGPTVSGGVRTTRIALEAHKNLFCREKCQSCRPGFEPVTSCVEPTAAAPMKNHRRSLEHYTKRALEFPLTNATLDPRNPARRQARLFNAPSSFPCSKHLQPRTATRTAKLYYRPNSSRSQNSKSKCKCSRAGARLN